MEEHGLQIREEKLKRTNHLKAIGNQSSVRWSVMKYGKDLQQSMAFLQLQPVRKYNGQKMPFAMAKRNLELNF